MKDILVIVFNDLSHDARVSRQVSFLNESFNVTVACFGNSPSINAKSVTLKKVKPNIPEKIIGGLSLLFRLYNFAYRIIYNYSHYINILSKKSYDLIIANDIETLPLAFGLKTNTKIVFDAHEYAPRHFEDKFVWRIFFKGMNEHLCRKYLPKVDGMLTVGTGLANEYSRHYPVNPIVLTNANWYKDISPTKTKPTSIRLVHHGAANPSRQLELMIDSMKHLDDHFTLDLILLTPSMANKKTSKYLNHLRKLIDGNSRIRIVSAVKSNEVVDLIHNYDVGVFLIPPINFNYENTLPNKLFDFIQARLAIAIGPTPEMVNVLERFDLGVVSKDFTSKEFARSIQTLSSDRIDYFKAQSHNAAKELTAEKNKEIMNSLVNKLLS